MNLIFVALMMVYVSAIILTFSKGAILALVITFLGILVFQFRSIFNRRNLNYLVFIVIFIVAAGAVSIFSFRLQPDFEKIYKNAYDVVSGGSVMERQEAYLVAWDAFSSSPVIGIGVGGFGAYFSGYPTSAPDYGWPIVNNQYLEVLAETGILGLCSFLLFLLSIFYYSLLAFRKAEDKLLRAVLLATNFALLGVLIQYMTFSTLYIMHIWLLIGLILATQNIIINRNRDGM